MTTDHLKWHTIDHYNGKTFGENCWDALTDEWQEWITTASDDWIENEMRRWSGRQAQRDLTQTEDIEYTALMHHADRREVFNPAEPPPTTEGESR